MAQRAGVSRGLNGGLARARRTAMKVVQPGPRDIQVDLDGLRALLTFGRQWRMLEAHGLTRGWRVRTTPSRTRNHTHVTITLPRARPLRDRVLLAALLGDDLKRAAFNYVRTVRRRRIPVAFFERMTP